jgi:hypothetical protein
MRLRGHCRMLNDHSLARCFCNLCFLLFYIELEWWFWRPWGGLCEEVSPIQGRNSLECWLLGRRRLQMQGEWDVRASLRLVSDEDLSITYRRQGRELPWAFLSLYVWKLTNSEAIDHNTYPGGSRLCCFVLREIETVDNLLPLQSRKGRHDRDNRNHPLSWLGKVR